MEVKEIRTIDIDEFFEIVDKEGGIYEVETPQGWKEIGGLVKKSNKECFLIRTKDGLELGGSEDHYVETNNGWEKLGEINVKNCYVKTKNGEKEIIAKESIGVQDTFDFEVKSDEHKYYANDIISHNTGKTTIGRIICNKAKDSTVIWITPESIVENTGRILNSIKQLYKLADFVSPCVIILEDLDLFAQSREKGVGNLELGSLMNILDGVNTITNAVTLGTTNRLDCIEAALKNRPGRFDRIVEIPSLNEELRYKMFTDKLKKWNVSKKILKYIVERTDEWTGAENQEFINTLNLHFIRDQKKSKRITIILVDKILETMRKFGVGAKSGTIFGFNKSEKIKNNK